MPVEAVWQVKLKLLPSSTVPEALLVMVGVWGTTAQKHNKYCLFYIHTLQPCIYTFCTHARHLSPTCTCYQSTRNATHSLQMLTAKPLPPIPSQLLKTNGTKSNHFYSLPSFFFSAPPPDAECRYNPPPSFHLTPLHIHTPTSPPSPATVHSCPKTLHFYRLRLSFGISGVVLRWLDSYLNVTDSVGWKQLGHPSLQC